MVYEFATYKLSVKFGFGDVDPQLCYRSVLFNGDDEILYLRSDSAAEQKMIVDDWVKVYRASSRGSL